MSYIYTLCTGQHRTLSRAEVIAMLERTLADFQAGGGTREQLYHLLSARDLLVAAQRRVRRGHETAQMLVHDVHGQSVVIEVERRFGGARR